ncbi:tail fiber protein [Puniceicoccaceae bacterium K14]|nr:tail fiber protein [Puniceicoccaceae bacterium K14]
MSDDAIIGEVRAIAGNIVPRHWAACDGRVFSITDPGFSDLFKVIGFIYGGSEESGTFNLPDLRGLAVMGTGHGVGLSQRTLGETGGATEVVLEESQVPAHKHPLVTSGEPRASAAPSGHFPSFENPNYNSQSDGSIMGDKAVGHTPPVGHVTEGHNNLQPYLPVNYVIALVGIEPA